MRYRIVLPGSESTVPPTKNLYRQRQQKKIKTVLLEWIKILIIREIFRILNEESVLDIWQAALDIMAQLTAF
jgi:hypothetical protein